MKRFHVHLHVDNLPQSIAFYSRLFAAEPSRVEADYAKWMLEDPRVNFAISTRGESAGLDHLGFQVDEAHELAELKARAEAAEGPLLDEGATTCCYARSEKHWVTDPQGIAWEHFHTLGNIPVFREAANEGSTCCAPRADAAQACCAPRADAAQACCAPQADTTQACCSPQADAAQACCAPQAIPARGAGSSCC